MHYNTFFSLLDFVLREICVDKGGGGCCALLVTGRHFGGLYWRGWGCRLCCGFRRRGLMRVGLLRTSRCLLGGRFLRSWRLGGGFGCKAMGRGVCATAVGRGPVVGGVSCWGGVLFSSLVLTFFRFWYRFRHLKRIMAKRALVR